MLVKYGLLVFPPGAKGMIYRYPRGGDQCPRQEFAEYDEEDYIMLTIWGYTGFFGPPWMGEWSVLSPDQQYDILLSAGTTREWIVSRPWRKT